MLTSWCETCAQNEPFFPGMQAYSTVPKRNSCRRVSWSLHWWLIVVRSCQELLACTSMLVVRWNFIVEATKQCIILWSDAGDPLPAWNIFLTLSNTYSPSFIYLTLSSLVRFSPCPNTLFKGRRPTFLVAQQLYGRILFFRLIKVKVK